MTGKIITKRKKVFAFVCIAIFWGEVILFVLTWLKILTITASRARKSPGCMRKPSIAGKIFFIRLL